MKKASKFAYLSKRKMWMWITSLAKESKWDEVEEGYASNRSI